MGLVVSLENKNEKQVQIVLKTEYIVNMYTSSSYCFKCEKITTNQKEIDVEKLINIIYNCYFRITKKWISKI